MSPGDRGAKLSASLHAPELRITDLCNSIFSFCFGKYWYCLPKDRSLIPLSHTPSRHDGDPTPKSEVNPQSLIQQWKSQCLYQKWFWDSPVTQLWLRSKEETAAGLLSCVLCCQKHSKKDGSSFSIGYHCACTWLVRPTKIMKVLASMGTKATS